MSVKLSRSAYAGHYGPTTGDRLRLADVEPAGRATYLELARHEASDGLASLGANEEPRVEWLASRAKIGQQLTYRTVTRSPRRILSNSAESAQTDGLKPDLRSGTWRTSERRRYQPPVG